MKFFKLMLASVFAMSLFAPSVNAGEVEVNWKNSDDYRDVHAGEGHRDKFKKSTFKMLDKHFAKLAEKLPEGYKLTITVNDLDLAGDVNHGGMRRIRIVKEIFFPRIKFDYQLVNASGEQLMNESTYLKDMGFMDHISLRYKSDRLGYEKKMLDEWFNDNFKAFIVAK